MPRKKLISPDPRDNLRLEVFDVLCFCTSRDSGLFVVSVGFCPKRCNPLDYKRFWADNSKVSYEIHCDSFDDAVETFRSVSLEIIHSLLYRS